MGRLKGKSALITGGTAGIGREIALLFKEEGASVAIVGTNAERASQVVRELEAIPGDPSQKCRSLLLDVSKTEEVNQGIEALLKEWGKIDILVNNAGITRDNLLMKMSEEDWDAVLSINLKSAYNTSKALVRSMMKNRQGVILNISSIVGLTGNAGQVNYAASKSGMIGLTKSLAKELASRKIRVNCIAPGYIETQMTQGLSDAIKESLLSKIPLERMGTPRDIAEAALFLSSDPASYITGQVLAVDGGMVI